MEVLRVPAVPPLSEILQHFIPKRLKRSCRPRYQWIEEGSIYDYAKVQTDPSSLRMSRTREVARNLDSADWLPLRGGLLETVENVLSWLIPDLF